MRVSEARKRLRACGWGELDCFQADSGRGKWVAHACARESSSDKLLGRTLAYLVVSFRKSRPEALTDLVERVEKMEKT